MALSDYSEYFGDILTDEKLYIVQGFRKKVR